MDDEDIEFVGDGDEGVHDRRIAAFRGAEDLDVEARDTYRRRIELRLMLAYIDTTDGPRTHQRDKNVPVSVSSHDRITRQLLGRDALPDDVNIGRVKRASRCQTGAGLWVGPSRHLGRLPSRQTC